MNERDPEHVIQKAAQTGGDTEGNKKKEAAKKKTAKKKAAKKKAAKKKTETAQDDQKKTRTNRAYPASAFRDALAIGRGIMNIGGGEKVRRETLLQKLQMNAGSSTTRQAITNSSRYHITEGSYKAEWLQLTPDGRLVVDPSSSPEVQREAEFRLAIQGIDPFKRLYDEYVGKRLPDRAVLKDFLEATLPDAGDLDECVDTFIVNAKNLGLVKEVAGADSLVALNDATPSVKSGLPDSRATTTGASWDKVCFYITPIGENGSEVRRHADTVMSSLVEPALDELGFKVVRADHIGEAGMITTQVLEHIRKCKLAVADLSFLNPNVFYEVALRHACRLPVVQIIRKADHLPFDVNQVRTVIVDTSDAYSLVPHLNVLRAEIASQARSAINDPGSVGNPVSIFYPLFYPVG